jgi:hypothetical protein
MYIAWESLSGTYINVMFFFDFLAFFGSFDTYATSVLRLLPNGESLMVLCLSTSGVPGGESITLGGRLSSPPPEWKGSSVSPKTVE